VQRTAIFVAMINFPCFEGAAHRNIKFNIKLFVPEIFIRIPRSDLYCFLPIQKLTVSLQADKHQPHDAETQPNRPFVILESDGATWRFRHRMIQDYFAALWKKETTFIPKITNNE
jgi:hypothetical protein